MMLSVHTRANMGSRAKAVIGLELQTVSAEITKHFVTILIVNMLCSLNPYGPSCDPISALSASISALVCTLSVLNDVIHVSTT